MNKDLLIAHDNINVVETLEKIDKGERGILYIIDAQNRLQGVVSDGDVRRWIVKTNDLSANVQAFMNSAPKYLFEYNMKEALEIKKKYHVNSVPILDHGQRIIDIIIFDITDVDEKISKQGDKLDVPVVIMAGGKGTRLYPYTKILPKPLVPIGEIPILERIFDEFHKYGTEKFYLTVNYKKNMIKSYFEELSPTYNVKYIEEMIPLGTCGGIKLIDETIDRPFFVSNCDSLIKADYNDLYDYHLKSGNAITIVAALKNITIPYGVLNTKENGELVNIEEKPRNTFFVNTGMYIVDPKLISIIPHRTFYHMTDLINDALRNGNRVGMYPISEDSFLDMGEFVELTRMEKKLNISPV